MALATHAPDTCGFTIMQGSTALLDDDGRPVFRKPTGRYLAKHAAEHTPKCEEPLLVWIRGRRVTRSPVQGVDGARWSCTASTFQNAVMMGAHHVQPPVDVQLLHQQCSQLTHNDLCSSQTEAKPDSNPSMTQPWDCA